MKNLVVELAKQLSTQFEAAIIKSYDIGIIDERKRIIEILNKKEVLSLSELSTQLKKELAEAGKGK